MQHMLCRAQNQARNCMQQGSYVPPAAEPPDPPVLLLFRPSGCASSLVELDSRVLAVRPFTAAATELIRGKCPRLTSSSTLCRADNVHHRGRRDRSRGAARRACSTHWEGDSECTAIVQHCGAAVLRLRYLTGSRPGWAAHHDLDRSQNRATAVAETAPRRLQPSQLPRTTCSAQTVFVQLGPQTANAVR